MKNNVYDKILIGVIVAIVTGGVTLLTNFISNDRVNITKNIRNAHDSILVIKTEMQHIKEDVREIKSDIKGASLARDFITNDNNTDSLIRKQLADLYQFVWLGPDLTEQGFQFGKDDPSKNPD
jgi:hypothetical protein